MSLGSSLARRNSGLAVPTPIYADANDSPIDLRKKVAIRRQRRFEYGYSDDDDENEDDDTSPTSNVHLDQSEASYWYRKNGYQNASSQYFLSLRNLHPVISEQYGIQYALFNSPEGTHVVPVPYSPFHHRSLVSEYKQRLHPDHLVPNYPRSPHDSSRNLDQDPPHYPDSKKYHSKNHWLSRGHDSPPARVVPAERRSSSPSPTEHFKKRHLKQSYWANQEVSSTESPGINGHGQISDQKKDENSNSSSLQAVKVDNPPQNLWLREKKSTRRRLRSYSCTDLRQDKQKDKKIFRIHTGYGSDSEITKSTSHKSPLQNHHHLNFNKTSHQPPEIRNTSPKVQKNQTLLNLLVGRANSNKVQVQQNKEVKDQHKKGIDVLLQHLKQNPVNHIRREDSYPWSVYEYYNHLVERSSRLNPSNYIPQSYMDQVEEDSANQQRKRPSRALTGKHVKHGTGASPSTLITLRQKIQERQKAKELLMLHGQPDGFGKMASPRNALSKKLKLGTFKRSKQDTLPPIYQASKLR